MRSLSTVEKAIDALFLLSEHPAGLGVTEIGQHLSLKTSSAHQFLVSLRKKGLVEQDALTRRYRIGPQMLRLCRSYFRQLDVNLIFPFLRDLRDKCGETVIFNIRSGNQIIRVAKAEGVHAVRRVIEIGDHQPLYLGSTGKAIMAYLPEAELEEVIKGFSEIMDLTHSEFPKMPLFDSKWRQELAKVRQQGYAASFGELYEGVHAMSAPVFNSSNHVTGCVTISGPGGRFNRRTMKAQVQPLLQSAYQISSTFGSTMPPDSLLKNSGPG